MVCFPRIKTVLLQPACLFKHGKGLARHLPLQTASIGGLLSLSVLYSLTAAAQTNLSPDDITNQIELHGRVSYEAVLPEDAIELQLDVPPDAPPIPTLQAMLTDTGNISSGDPTLPPQPKLKSELSPRLARIRDTYTMLWSFGGGVGNGVFKNIQSRDDAIDKLTANFKNPIGRSIQGWKEDNDSFRTNLVEHPVMWFTMATYLKTKGASDRETIVLTQIANYVWEHIIEGTYVTPSGKDLLVDYLSCKAALYFYDKPLGRYVAKKINQVTSWGTKHNIVIEPTFGPGAYLQGSKAGTRIRIYVR